MATPSPMLRLQLVHGPVPGATSLLVVLARAGVSDAAVISPAPVQSFRAEYLLHKAT